VNLSDEALDAAINTYLGGRDPDHANRQHLRDRFRAIGDALAPHIMAAVVERDGRRQWRVTGDPGPQFGLYSFTWPRRGSDEDGEEQARKFMAMFHEPGRTPWPDGPHLHHRTVYTHEGDWVPDTPQGPR
jgi:hypothetical protein